MVLRRDGMEFWDKLFDKEILFILLVFGLPAISIVCYTIASVIKHRADNELKSLMIERGMSAEEIERVIKAGEEDEDSEDKK